MPETTLTRALNVQSVLCWKMVFKRACLDVRCVISYAQGFTDKYTWKGTAEHPLPFDESFQPKAAVQSLLDQFDE